MHLLSLLQLERLEHPGWTDAACVRSIAAAAIVELGIRSPPVDVGMVASYFDIVDVVEDPALDVAGCLVCSGGESLIRVRATDSRGRRRFTVCHECAHTFFPGFSFATQYRCSPRPAVARDSGLETLCDVGASELLLPPALVQPLVTTMPFSLGAVEHLSDEFDASLLAAGYSYVANRNEPVALLTFEPRQSPRQAGTDAPVKLRLQTVRTSGPWPYFRQHKSVDRGSVFDRARDGEVVFERATLEGISVEPVEVEVSTQLYPYFDGKQLRHRVIALVRRPKSAS